MRNCWCKAAFTPGSTTCSIVFRKVKAVPPTGLRDRRSDDVARVIPDLCLRESCRGIVCAELFFLLEAAPSVREPFRAIVAFVPAIGAPAARETSPASAAFPREKGAGIFRETPHAVRAAFPGAAGGIPR